MTASFPATATGVVAYTDGSAMPDTGHFGMGAHGFAYRYPGDNEKPTKINAYIATDRGYVLEKDLPGSEGTPVIIEHYLDVSIPGGDGGTNNVAEILAPAVLIESFPELFAQIKRLHILGDSKYMLQGATQWVYGWIRNGWLTSTGADVSNREHWERLHAHLEQLRAVAEVTFEWVRGHNDNLGNVQADYLAGTATQKSIAGAALDPFIDHSPVQGYWKSEVDLHPLISLKRIYFNTDREFHTPGTYYQTGYSDTKHITGKRTPDAVFSVVSLNEPDDVVETVLARQHSQESEFNKIVFIKLDRLRDQNVFKFLKHHGGFSLMRDRCNENLNFMDRKPVTMEVKAGELPLRSVEVLNHLEEILGKFMAQYPETGTIDPGAVEYKLHNVTDHFYDNGEKKHGKVVTPIRLLKKVFGVGVRDTKIGLDIDGKVWDLPLVFMDDMPGRNAMKNLEEKLPEVFLITWKESPKLLRYCTVIQTQDAVGIWSNYFANQLFI